MVVILDLFLLPGRLDAFACGMLQLSIRDYPVAFGWRGRSKLSGLGNRLRTHALSSKLMLILNFQKGQTPKTVASAPQILEAIKSRGFWVILLQARCKCNLKESLGPARGKRRSNRSSKIAGWGICLMKTMCTAEKEWGLDFSERGSGWDLLIPGLTSPSAERHNW